MHHMNLSFLACLIFQPSKEVILERVRAKTQKVAAKVSERLGRIKKLREENKIDDTMLIELMNQARRNANATFYRLASNVRGSGREGEVVQEVIITAGVAAALQAESDMVEDERAALERLHRIERNFDHVKEPLTVSFTDLEFLEM